MPGSRVGRRRTQALRGDRAAPSIDVLADRQVQARLVLEPDERHDPMERGLGRRLVAGPEATDDLDQELREPEPRHRPGSPAPQLLEQHDPAQAAEDAQVGSSGHQPTDLGRTRLVFELDDTARRRRLGDRREDVHGHRHAAARRVVLDDDRDRDRVRDGPVMGDHSRIVGPGQGGRRQHDRVRARGLGPTGEGHGAVRAGVAHSDAHRQIRGRREHPTDDRVAFVVTEPPGFAEHAQDGHAIDAVRGDEAGQRRQAVDVQRAIRLERGGDDRPDAFEPLDAGRHR